jgi:hypothetical protein
LPERTYENGPFAEALGAVVESVLLSVLMEMVIPVYSTRTRTNVCPVPQATLAGGAGSWAAVVSRVPETWPPLLKKGPAGALKLPVEAFLFWARGKLPPPFWQP